MPVRGIPVRPLCHRMSRRGAALVALMLCGTQAGCYSYRAAPPGSLTPGADVRLLLTAEGTAALAETAGLRLRTLEGSLQRVRADGALLILPGDVTTIDGDALPWRRGTVTVPVQALLGTERRTINRRRTAGFAGVIAGVFTGVVVVALRSIWGRGGASQGSGPGTPE